MHRAQTTRERAPILHGFLATLFSLPWCCIVPAVLSLLSLGFASLSRVWVARWNFVFLGFSLLFLGRAFWLIYGRGQGSPWARRLTWATAAVVILLWAWRFYPIL